ncbi:MAG: GntR family transcriptional regulator [Clostridiales bacterium]|nr:GntR family transcriptional regulator [Clostridiales bacterium]NLZ90323.1 GntR family transcriptional regulator [Clostridiales bacterium]HOC09572.1 GntR family transcriptional regulator [Bacillota bacterium]HQA47586.1 GntR family transcriptional regulator [Bacillota bacterium]HQD41190.1 GntR family transcriptional regulator [Bacillota bacterium]
MLIDFNSEKPIYLQLAEAIEDNILKGIFQEETQIISTTEISVKYKINPATAGKGVNVLVDEGILYKKRGVGMFVSTGARERILKKRRKNFLQDFILPLMDEAFKLGISKEEIIGMIEGRKEI